VCVVFISLFNPLQTYEVPPDEQIFVKQGYFIGIFYPEDGAGGIYYETAALSVSSIWTMSLTVKVPKATDIPNDLQINEIRQKLPSLVAFIIEGICKLNYPCPKSLHSYITNSMI
jgi:hypothetical protein